LVSLQLFAHPFSSYCQKVLIALWANGAEFEYRLLERDHPENFAELKQRSPFGLFPLLIDDGKPVLETSIIIEHLQLHHPGPTTWIPDGDEGLRVRFLDRFFDLYIMNTMQVGVANALRPEGTADAYGEEWARERLNTAYDWLDANLGETWAVADQFTMADCAAAPSLFYADWVEPIGDARPRLAAYRARLLAHPIVARAVDEGRPYRHYFPLGAPDRD
jgi:glutathione S-transferase